MNRKRTIKNMRIIIGVLILLSFFIFPIYLLAENIQFDYAKEIMEIQTEKDFVIKTNKPVKSVEIKLVYFDDENNVVLTETISVNANGVSQIEKTAKKDVQNATRYQISEISATTIDDVKMEIISNIFTYLFILLFFVSLRFNEVKKQENGQSVVVYTGLLNHEMLIDGKVVARKKLMFFIEPIVLKAEVDKKYIVTASITSLKFIKISSEPMNVIVENNEQQELKESIKKVKKQTSKKVADEPKESAAKTKEKKENPIIKIIEE